MLDRPWVRLVLGAVVAALLGAMAARVAVSASAGDGGGACAPGTSGGRGSSGGGASGGGSCGGSPTGGGRGAADGRSGTGGSEGGGAAASEGGSGGATATLGGGSGRVKVHVTGEVRRPGVYDLPEGTRVDGAVRRAGGPTRDGDRQALNLAAPVRDGQQVRVPLKASAVAARGASGRTGGAGAGGSAATGDGSSSGGAAGTGAPLDLNTASLEELQTLDGVGEATAQKIVQLREERGGLSGVDDLDEIPGIGAKKLEALRAQLEG